MKKTLSMLVALLLCFSLATVAFAAPTPTVSSTGASMLLETQVPANHKITITYNDGGYVLVDGNFIPSGSVMDVPRLDALNLDIITKPEAHLQKVLINGEDKTADMEHGRLTFQNVHTDMQIIFGFQNCSDVVPPEEDKCVHFAVSGYVYQGENLLPNAKLDFDLGNIKTEADKDAAYRVEKIKDGRHKVTICDADGAVLGEEIFALAEKEGLVEPRVEKLPDGTQIIFVPKGRTEVKLDFVVEDDGSVSIRPSVDIPDAPVPTPTPKPTPKPPISQTGGVFYNTVQFYGLTFLAASAFFFLFLLLPIAKRKKETKAENSSVM